MMRLSETLIANMTLNARCLLRQTKLILTFILLAHTPNYAQDNHVVGFPDAAGELLYNGIRLPKIWPPADGNPYTTEPMSIPYLEHPPKVLPINTGRQLFVDDFLIERTNLVRVFHQAKKYKNNPVMQNGSLRIGGAFYDPIEQHFDLFYNDGPLGVGLAFSSDLKHWSRRAEGKSGQDHRIVLPKGGANSFWLHIDSSNTGSFYVMRANRMDPRPKDNPNVPYINAIWQNMLQTSTDGITWSDEIPLGRSNDYSSFFYNPFRQVWVFSLKHNVPRVGKKVYRSRYYAERKKISEVGGFDDAVFWVNADKLDKPHPAVGDSAQLYSLQGIAYESMMLGAFQIHLGPSNEISEKKKEPKYTVIKLGYSRDGFHWYRPDRKPFISGTYHDGDWDKAFINIPQGICFVVGDTLWFPYGGYSGVDSDGKRGMYRGASIGMATLRRDGFASMEAGQQPGMLQTKPVVFNGKHLFVNVDCPHGELRVEVLDENDRVLKQFAANVCKPIRADRTLCEVGWQSEKDVSSLTGKRVKFRFHLTNGKLYAFWVSPDKSGASYGYIGAGGLGYEGVIDNQGMKAYSK